MHVSNIYNEKVLKVIMAMVESSTCHFGLTIVGISLSASTTLVEALVPCQKRSSSNIVFNYFAPGHGKGICDSEGGILKHKVSAAS